MNYVANAHAHDNIGRYCAGNIKPTYTLATAVFASFIVLAKLTILG